MQDKPKSEPGHKKGPVLLGPDGAPVTANHPPSKAEESERLKHEAKQAQDQYLRALAEFENTKKRLHREKEEFVKYAAETMLRELLPIVDSLDQALVAVDPSTGPAEAGLARSFDTAQDRVPSESRGTQDSAQQVDREGYGVPAGLRKQADVQAVLKGVQLIRQQLLKLLEKEGVKRIPTVGEPFDPHRHEAVAKVEAADGTPDETIVEEVQVGYTMHGKVIRPAMVKVAKHGETTKE